MESDKVEVAALTPRQEMAVRELARGKGVASAARAVGVGRATLFRWLREPEFVACMNRWRSGVKELVRGQLYAGAGDAAVTLTKAAKQGDVRAATNLLKGLGMLTPEEQGSEDPQVVAQQRDLAERSDRVQLDRLDLSLKEVEGLAEVLCRPPAPRIPRVSPVPLAPAASPVSPPVEGVGGISDAVAILDGAADRKLAEGVPMAEAVVAAKERKKRRSADDIAREEYEREMKQFEIAIEKVNAEARARMEREGAG